MLGMATPLQKKSIPPVCYQLEGCSLLNLLCVQCAAQGSNYEVWLVHGWTWVRWRGLRIEWDLCYIVLISFFSYINYTHEQHTFIQTHSHLHTSFTDSIRLYHHHTVGVLGFLAEIESLKWDWYKYETTIKYHPNTYRQEWTETELKKPETFPWGLSTAKNAQHIGTIGYFINITEKKKKKIHY